MRYVISALCSGATVLLLSACVLTQSVAETPGDESLWISVDKRPGDVALMPEVPMRRIAFETTEGTFMAVDVSPDGETLVFDLLGDLYTLPIKGGDAVPLTTGTAWDESPRFSPDGAYVYFLSDRVGHKNVWRISLADQSLQPISGSGNDVIGGLNWLPSADTYRSGEVLSGLTWSQDGSRLLASVLVTVGAFTGRSFDRMLHAIDPISGALTPVAEPPGPMRIAGRTARNSISIFSAVESDDGQVFYSSINFEGGQWAGVHLFVFDARSRKHTAITPQDATYNEFKPQLSHDGNLLAYFRQYDNRRTELRILNRATGDDRELVPLENADDMGYSKAKADDRPNFAFTPDDKAVIFWHDGKIRRVDIAGGQLKTIPFRARVELEVAERVRPAVQRLDGYDEASTVRWPSLSRDGRTLVFSAVGYVWVRDMATGDVRRLTDADEFEYMPAISPDGSSVAYISFARAGINYDRGRLMVADIASGQIRELLASAGEDYLLPRWSADGSKIALIREGGWTLSRDGGEWNIGSPPMAGWTSAADGVFHEVASISDSGPFARSFIYAQSVGFNAAGTELWASYPQSNVSVILTTANLETGDSRTLAFATPEVGGIVPSPDLRHVALTRRDGSVWVMPFEAGDTRVTVSTRASSARRVSQNGGYFVDWNNTNQITFGFAKDVYRYRLDHSSGDPESVDDELSAIRIEVPIVIPATAQQTAFTGARLITISGDAGTGTVIESGTLIVEGERIVAIGAADTIAIPGDAQVVDVAGKTILPGFLDTHYHGLGGTALALPRDRGFDDPSAIKFGVTTAWNPGSLVFDDGGPAISDLQRAGRIPAPRWSHTMNGARPVELLSNYSAAQAPAEQLRIMGSAVLKEYNTPTREQRQWISVAARENGVGVVSHLDSFEDIVTRIFDGYTGGDHITIPVPLSRDMLELLQQSGFVWTPNLLYTSAGWVGEYTDPQLYYCNAVSQTDRAFLIVKTESECDGEYQAPSVDFAVHRVSQAAEYAALAASNGASIGASAHNGPGSKLHQELWLLWRGGMSIGDVLRASTMTNAEKLGLQEEIGSLEVGKMADFLVLHENPLDDILNTVSVKYTIQGGVIYDADAVERITPEELQHRLSVEQVAANDDQASLPKTGTDD